MIWILIAALNGNIETISQFDTEIQCELAKAQYQTTSVELSCQSEKRYKCVIVSETPTVPEHRLCKIENGTWEVFK